MCVRAHAAESAVVPSGGRRACASLMGRGWVAAAVGQHRYVGGRAGCRHSPSAPVYSLCECGSVREHRDMCAPPLSARGPGVCVCLCWAFVVCVACAIYNLCAARVPGDWLTVWRDV